MIDQDTDNNNLLPDTFSITSGSYGGGIDAYESQMDALDNRGANVQFLDNEPFEEEVPVGNVSLDGYIVEYFDGSTDFISSSEIDSYLQEWIEEDEDDGGNGIYDGNMSIECDVLYSYRSSSMSLNTNEYKPFDGVGDDQTKARIPIYVDGVRVSIGGYFRETFTSINYGLQGQVNAQPVLSFFRIS